MSYSRLTQTRRWISIVTRLAMLGGVAVGLSCLLLEDAGYPQMMPILITAFALFVMGALISGVCELLFKIEANTHRMHEVLLETHTHQDKLNQILEIVRDNSQLSDGVKSITHRDLERDALRKAIREEILKEDWEAAYSLIEDMEDRFGYRVEAYNYRKEVDEFRARVIEEKVLVSIRQIRSQVADKNWDAAQAEADRLLKLAPKKDARVAEVVNELTSRKEAFKASLLSQWHEAVESKNLDRSIELLKEIDPYLSREEADKLEDSARSIFKAKLLDLGVKFREAVTEKRWDDAIEIGEQIRSEYPNSKMAQEVGESMEALRAKASAAGASAT